MKHPCIYHVKSCDSQHIFFLHPTRMFWARCIPDFIDDSVDILCLPTASYSCIATDRKKRWTHLDMDHQHVGIYLYSC